MADRDPQPTPEELEQAQATADATAHERVWTEPVEFGEPVEYDPAEYEPPLTPEQLEKIRGEQG